MNVECNFFGPLREVVDEKTVVRQVAADASVGDLLADLANEFPDLQNGLFDGDELGAVTVTKNGTNVNHLDGLETPLEDGDVIRAAPPVVGGAARRGTRKQPKRTRENAR